MIKLERCMIGKYSVILKIDSIFGENLIGPTLKKGVDKQKSIIR